MRIVGGTFRGRALASPKQACPKHEGLRPTSDRVRESLFNILEHGIPDISLKGTRVIDLWIAAAFLCVKAKASGINVVVKRFLETEKIAKRSYKDWMEKTNKKD